MGCLDTETMREGELAIEYWTEPIVTIRKYDKDGKEIKSKSKKIENPAAESIKRWGFTNDITEFKKQFEFYVGRPYEQGMPYIASDMRKFQIGIVEFGKMLAKDGYGWASPISLRVGRNKARKNPIINSYYFTLNDAKSFRTEHGSNMTNAFNIMIASLRNAVVEYDALKPTSSLDLIGKFSATKKRMITFNKLTKLENNYLEYIRSVEAGTVVEGRDATKDLGILMKFLENEGAVFEDFISIVEGGVKGKELEKKYSQFSSKGYHSNQLLRAASAWQTIETYAKKLLLKSIDAMTEPRHEKPEFSGIIALRYGDSAAGLRLSQEYRKTRDMLADTETGYIPHYVFDLIGEMMQLRDTVVNEPKQSETIIGEYVKRASEINVQLSDRLKHKGKNISDYFSRNPLLYADKYIADVIRFNHSTFVDKAFLAGIHKLTEVKSLNPGTKEAEAAEFFMEQMSNLHQTTKGIAAQEMSKYQQNLDRTINAAYYMSKLGWSTRSPVRNLTQRLQNMVMYSGAGWSVAYKAYKADTDYNAIAEAEMKKYGFEFADIAQVTEGALSTQDLMAQGIDYQSGMLTTAQGKTIMDMIASTTHKLAIKSAEQTPLDIITLGASGKVFSMQAIELSNRKSTFKLAFHHRMEQLKESSKYARVNYSDKNFDAEVLTPNAKLLKEMKTKAGKYAADMTGFVHFDYAPHGKATAISGSFAKRLFFKFGHYKLSFIDYQAQLFKDYKRAFKAGDYTGEEFHRVTRLAFISAIGEIGSTVFNINMAKYISNDTLEWVKDWVGVFQGDEDAAHGSGVPGLLHMAPMSDIVNIINLGMASRYWRLPFDPGSTGAKLMGFEDLGYMKSNEFNSSLLSIGQVEAGRLVNSTIPALMKSNAWHAIQAEFGAFPGQTPLGIDTKKTREKFLQSKPIRKMKSVYEDIFDVNLTKDQRKRKKQQLSRQDRFKAIGALTDI